MTAYIVTQRTAEIVVRLALGRRSARRDHDDCASRRRGGALNPLHALRTELAGPWNVDASRDRSSGIFSHSVIKVCADLIFVELILG
jgi:hypothetical protein